MLDFLLLLLTLLYILGLLSHAPGHGMVQQIRLHITKPDDFGSIPRAQMVKDNQFSRAFLQLPHTGHSMCTYTHTHPQ